MSVPTKACGRPQALLCPCVARAQSATLPWRTTPVARGEGWNAAPHPPALNMAASNGLSRASKREPQALSVILSNAAQKALGGGISGALAMVVQVVALMWMRTTINFQHKYGMSTSQALAALYAQGGIARFYQGMTAALLQAPLSRFGDTTSYAGMTALLETVDSIPPSLKTLCASLSAALFRIGITPIDTFKTTLQGNDTLLPRLRSAFCLFLYSPPLCSSRVP